MITTIASALWATTALYHFAHIFNKENNAPIESLIFSFACATTAYLLIS